MHAGAYDDKRSSFSSVDSLNLSKTDLDALLMDDGYIHDESPSQAPNPQPAPPSRRSSIDSPQKMHTITCAVCGKVTSFPCAFRSYGRRDMMSDSIGSWGLSDGSPPDNSNGNAVVVGHDLDNRDDNTARSKIEGEPPSPSQLDFHLKRLLNFMSESEKTRRFAHLKITQILNQEETNEEGGQQIVTSFAEIKASRRKPRRRKIRKVDREQESNKQQE